MSSATTSRRPIESGDPGHPGARGDDRDEHDQRLDHPGLVHVRHRSRDRRAEDHAGDQPHQEHACPRTSSRTSSRSRSTTCRSSQLAVTGYDDEATIQVAARGIRHPRPRRHRRRERRAGSSAVAASASRSLRMPRPSPPRATRSRPSATPWSRTACCSPAAASTEGDQTLTVQTGRQARSRGGDRGSAARAVDARAGARRAPSRSRTSRPSPQEQDPVTSISRVNGEPALTDRRDEAARRRTPSTSRARSTPRSPRCRTRSARTSSSPSSSTRPRTSSSRSTRSPRRACSACCSPSSSS